MKIRFLLNLSMLALLAFCGCGGSSEIEMKQAARAMEDAKKMHAEKLAPMDYEKAQTAWDHAQAAEKEGKTGAAKVLYSSASIFFNKASDIARSKGTALRRELDNIQPMMAQNFDQVKIDLVNNALSARQQVRIRSLVSEIEKENTALDKLVAEQDLAKALAKAKEVQTKIYQAQLILSGQKAN